GSSRERHEGLRGYAGSQSEACPGAGLARRWRPLSGQRGVSDRRSNEGPGALGAWSARDADSRRSRSLQRCGAHPARRRAPDRYALHAHTGYGAAAHRKGSFRLRTYLRVAETVLPKPRYAPARRIAVRSRRRLQPARRRGKGPRLLRADPRRTAGHGLRQASESVDGDQIAAPESDRLRRLPRRQVEVLDRNFQPLLLFNPYLPVISGACKA